MRMRPELKEYLRAAAKRDAKTETGFVEHLINEHKKQNPL